MHLFKTILTGAFCVAAGLAVSTSAEAQGKRKFVKIDNACVYGSVFCKASVRGNDGKLYDLSGMRGRPSPGTLIDFRGVEGEVTSACGTRIYGKVTSKGICIVPFRPF